MTTKAISLDNTNNIQPRKMKFDYSDLENAKYWYNGNSVMTTMLAALSAIFPPGEQQFIHSIRHYQDQITDPSLQKEIRGFIGQEGHHGHQHKKANEYLDSTGLYATRLEKHFQRFLDRTKDSFPPEDQLAQTVAAEHITAVMAEYVLTHSEFTKHMSDSVRELVLWHAVEEIEHKSVAFEVYMRCVGDRKRLKRNMRLIMTVFPLRTFAYQLALLYWDKKVPSVREIRQFYKLVLGKNGLIRDIRQPFNEFFDDDFHPWNQDNSDLVKQWKRDHDYPNVLDAA